MKNLERLEIKSNKIQSIPLEIGQLENLISLSIAYNKVTHLPLELGNLNKIEKISARSNPLVFPTYDIVKAGINNTLSFLRQQQDLNSESLLLELQKQLIVPVHQYLLLFKEYVKTVKKKEVYFEVSEVNQGLKLNIKPNQDITIENIKKLFT